MLDSMKDQKYEWSIPDFVISKVVTTSLKLLIASSRETLADISTV